MEQTVLSPFDVGSRGNTRQSSDRASAETIERDPDGAPTTNLEK